VRAGVEDYDTWLRPTTARGVASQKGLEEAQGGVFVLAALGFSFIPGENPKIKEARNEKDASWRAVSDGDRFRLIPGAGGRCRGAGSRDWRDS